MPLGYRCIAARHLGTERQDDHKEYAASQDAGRI
jgi:hypothetical protein